MGVNEGSTGNYTLAGGTLTTGRAGIGANGEAVFTQSGGRYTNSELVVLGQGGGSGTYNLDGGTLAAIQVRGFGSSTFNFNGGTFEAINTFALLQTLTRINVRDGGAIIDTAGFNASIPSDLLHSDIEGDADIDGGLTKKGAGVLTVIGVNTYTGDTTVSEGALDFGTGSIGVAGSTATLAVNGPVDTRMVMRDGATLTTGEVIIGADGTGEFFHSDGVHTIVGAEGLVLGRDAASSGRYVLSGGTLETAKVSGGEGTGTFEFDGGTLRAGASGTEFFGGLASAVIHDGDAMIDTAEFDVTVSQSLAGDAGTASALIKNGTGTLRLAGTNTYAGTTTVNAGRLLVDGRIAGGATVLSDATFGGSGSIGGNVSIASGATLAPGSSAGLLTVDGGVDLAAGGTFVFELGGAVAGTGYDQLTFGLEANLAGALTLNITVGFVPTVGQEFYLLVGTGTGGVIGEFSNAPGGLITDDAGNTYQLDYAAHDPLDLSNDLFNDVKLTALTVVPEPSTVALVVAAGGLLLWVRHGRRRRV